ncbi:MAG: RNA-binding transcriptional accessory protein [Lachnospiraceae bacterium]|jgi:uncharacterized protein|nr:RNA-binding transcriptional accessory protein [Lachnospiraceae bacterium]
MDINQVISEELKIKKSQIDAAVKLIDEGNTLPFIARYRKEVTGSLNDEQLRDLFARLTYLRNLEDKKAQVIKILEEQGNLTPELQASIEKAENLVTVDDLYRPYRPKRRTRATIAKEKGLEPLAEMIIARQIEEDVFSFAEKFVDEEKEVKTKEEAIEGASDIIAEMISDNADYRTWIRHETTTKGKLVSVAKNPDESTVYDMYYEFEEPVSKVAGHRVLAINRGEKEKVLTVKIDAPEEDVLHYLETRVINRKNLVLKPVKQKEEKSFNKNFNNNSEFGKLLSGLHLEEDKPKKKNLKKGEEQKFELVLEDAPDPLFIGIPKELLDKKVIQNDSVVEVIKNATEDAYKRLIAPSIEREIRSELTEKAEDAAIKVFGTNLEQLLLQPPILGKTVLGWDPAFRTGCKLAVVSPTGKVLDTTVIYPTAPTTKEKQLASANTIWKLIKKYGVDIISVGNGTASRESESFIADFLKEHNKDFEKKVSYIIVSEAGASVYSASKLATEEFPEFDVGQRSATSIARRLQDPLAELVKIDPKSIGVGQYQHDMDQKKLKESLSGVVERAVNSVGVDLNTASSSLLTYVSGITSTLAKNIIAYREENGEFTDRKELKKVSKLGPKAFEQCAGFLRIKNGKNILDNTGVHPESYDATTKLLKEMGLSKDDVKEGKLSTLGKEIKDYKGLSENIGIGEETLKDIVKELEKPGRDPREELPKPVLRTDVLDMKDLKEGMILTGTVRNIIDFGAFVDIGVHQDGLVHISQITNKKFIKHPLDVLKIGDVVNVRVISVDEKKGRIGLSMIDV